MLRAAFVLAVVTCLAASARCFAVPAMPFPGLAATVDGSDAIAVVEIGGPPDPSPGPTFHFTHSCRVCLSLKGDLPAGATLPVGLYSWGGRERVRLGTKRLVFLRAGVRADGVVRYESPQHAGTDIDVSGVPLDGLPEDATAEEKIRVLLRRRLEHQEGEGFAADPLLKQMLGS